MALEKADRTEISKFVRDTVQRLPPHAVKAMGIGRISGTPEAGTPPAGDSSDRIATTSFIGTAIANAIGSLTTGVSSVFGRTGAVVAQAGDYSISQITGAVTSVFGRSGAVVATSGDYTAAQVTHALDLSNAGTQTLSGTLNAAGLQVGSKALPGTEIGYDQITSNVSITGTSLAAATTVITAAAHTFDGSPVIMEFFTPMIQTPSVVAGNVIVELFESGDSIARIAEVITPAAAIMNLTLRSTWRFTPTAGSHTYTVKAFASSTTGAPTIYAGAAGDDVLPPAFLRFTKV